MAGVLSQAIKCNKCSAEKSLENFPKNKKCSLGVEKTCKECKNKNNVAYSKRTNHQRKNEWLEKNKEKHKQHCAEWRENNKELRRFYSSSYRAKLKQAKVLWANIEAIKNIYKNCPEGFHVDHIIPLKGKYVSGLHVETNLQYLPIYENLSKGNKWMN